jgi:MFS family permease
LSEKKPFPYLLVAIIWLGWIFINQSIFILDPILPAIEEHFQILHIEAGVLISSYMIGYAVMQLFAGMLGEQFGEERFLVIGILGTSLSTVLTWTLTNFMQMILIRFLTGLFAGMYYAPSNALITKAAAGEDRGKALGLVFSSGPASRMLVFVLSGILIMQNVPWQNLFLYYGFPGLIATPMMFLLLKKRRFHEVDTTRVERVRTNIWHTLKQRAVIQVLTFNFVLALAARPIRTFLSVFFVTERGLTIPDASFLMNVVNIAGVICTPLAGFLTDKFGFKVPSYIAMTITSVVTISVPLTQVGVHTVISFVLWGLFGCMTGTAFMVLLTEVVPDRVRGTFFGILNFVGWIGGTVGPIVLGSVIDLFDFTIFFYTSVFILLIATSIIVSIKRP